MEPGQSITFLPHLMREFPVELTLQAGRLTASIDVQISAQDQIHASEAKSLTFRGPGDILAIQPRMIARLEPPAGSTNFEPNYFPFIEFVDPDFLWRYSLEPNAGAERIHPWLSLIVLTGAEIEQMSQENQIDVVTRLRDDRQLLSVRGDLVPRLDHAWASAHVQLNGINPEETIDEFLTEHPANHCCRLFCCRRLQPEMRYSAFLVPNYQSAVNTALGVADAQADNAKAWINPLPSDVIRLPIYHTWSFQTSVRGDFEELAKNLKPVAVDPSRIGRRAVDACRMSSEQPETIPFFLREGAVAPPNFEAVRSSYAEGSSGLPLTVRLKDSLNESLTPTSQEHDASDDDPDPLVTSPVYGRHYRKTGSIEYPSGDSWPDESPWVHEVNLDFRYRVAGGLGTRVVRQHQDAYMKECWRQVGQIRAANERTRLTKAAAVLGKAMHRKHVKPQSDDRHLLTTVPFHVHVTTTSQGKGVTFRKTFAQSGIVHGVLSQTFKRVAHQRIAIHRAKPSQPWEKAISPPRLLRSLGPRPIADSQALAGQMGIAMPAVAAQAAVPKAEIISVKPVHLAKDFRPRVDLAKSLMTKLNGLVRYAGGAVITDTFDPPMQAPRVRQPMYKPLEQLSGDYVLPGLEFLENNGVMLLEENRRFIEAYMIGLNHEMGRELVWQRFPTDKRGTVFQYFWDPATTDDRTDIKDIHLWKNALGDNRSTTDVANLILVIKGELIRRYPATIVYGVRLTELYSELYPDDEPVAEELIIDPLFRAQVGADILMVGFPFSIDQVQGRLKDGEYYFVLQENQDLPRFGLDVQSAIVRRPEFSASLEAAMMASAVSEAGHSPSSGPVNDDLSWSHIPARHLRAGYIDVFDTRLFGQTSASVASRTYQKPIQVVIHSSHLLPTGETPWRPALSAKLGGSSRTLGATRR